MSPKRVSDTEALRCIAFSCNILLAVVLVRSPDLRDNLSGAAWSSRSSSTAYCSIIISLVLLVLLFQFSSCFSALIILLLATKEAI